MTEPSTETPLGATVSDGGVHFGVWAPKADRIDVVFEEADCTTSHRLERLSVGIHHGAVEGAGPGTRYRYQIDGGSSYPDPRSRFQPAGVHGPSQVVDPEAFFWSDHDWSGIRADQLIIYELHVGAYTPEGTFNALERELPELKRLGVTAIEIMPVADFPGDRNWGYDGVYWFAPSRAYGKPDDLRGLVDAAHGIGLAVILDVVYNHFGPDGNYARAYSDDYFTDRHQTPWGEAIDFDGPNASFVRNLVLDNVRHWIQEYHVDGLRLDASDLLFDDSTPHILQEIQECARSATDRNLVIISEEARNDVRPIRPVGRSGYGIDAVWADDFHHELRVFLTNAAENYYADYAGSMIDLCTAINEGFLYQGQHSAVLGAPRGTRVTDEPASAFVFFIQNHDQVGNRPFGERLHHEIDADRYAVASMLLLMLPETPMLFMGQEFAASTPFLYFTDHGPELGQLVTEGRRSEFGGFRAFGDERLNDAIPDPQAERTFTASKLRLKERQTNAGIYELYRDLIALRKGDDVLNDRSRERCRAQPCGAQALAVHRWSGSGHRLLIANFGSELEIQAGDLDSIDLPEPRRWTQLLSADERKYSGRDPAESTDRDGERAILIIPARSAVLVALD
jgi:maltooligosyltrehalose trehalohydrolase